MTKKEKLGIAACVVLLALLWLGMSPEAWDSIQTNEPGKVVTGQSR